MAASQSVKAAKMMAAVVGDDGANQVNKMRNGSADQKAVSTIQGNPSKRRLAITAVDVSEYKGSRRVLQQVQPIGHCL